MSKKSIIESLLSGYVEGRLTMEEKRQFFDLLADSSNEIIFREVLLKNINFTSEFQQQAGKEPDFSGIFHKIIEEIDRKDSEEAELKLIQKEILVQKNIRIFICSCCCVCICILYRKII